VVFAEADSAPRIQVARQSALGEGLCRMRFAKQVFGPGPRNDDDFVALVAIVVNRRRGDEGALGKSRIAGNFATDADHCDASLVGGTKNLPVLQA
jgi:hypothetical protein